VTRLFLRTTRSGIDIRAYLVTRGITGPGLEVGLSSSHAIGLLLPGGSGPPGPDSPVALGATVFGDRAGGGTAVAVHAGSNVATVRAEFSSGATDAMHPVDGWAVLATSGTKASGRLVALDADGRRLSAVTIPRPVPSGEGFPGESRASFVRVTSQGVLVIGHTVQPDRNGPRWLYPYLADRASVQLGLEGIVACRPSAPRELDAGVLVVGAAEGQPITVVVVHAGAAIARVSVRFSTGIADSMAPVGGQAVLATLGTVDRAGRLDSMPRAVIDGFAHNGRLVASTPLFPNASPYTECVS
jgi:hypothetical protein